MRLLILFLVITFLSCADNKVEVKDQLKDSTVDIDLKPASKLLYDSTNTLEDKIQTLELDYIVWGCACANWVTITDYKKYADSGQLASHCIFIEPADTSLKNADNIIPSEDYIKVTGQFYTRKGYPKGTYQREEQLDSARIFRYSKISVLKHKKYR
jgi:hypothetical protein